jgi:hypothetical protein
MLRFRRLAFTEGRRVGLVPADARIGDLICALGVFMALVVLRPVRDGLFEVVGTGYVDGLMLGEGFGASDPPTIWKFCICLCLKSGCYFNRLILKGGHMFKVSYLYPFS